MAKEKSSYGLRHFNLELSLKFGWCHAQDLFKIKNSNLLHANPLNHIPASTYMFKVMNKSTGFNVDLKYLQY